MAMQTRELTVTAAGLDLRVKIWGEPGNPPLLALHGWQDNAASFDLLAPQLPDYYWVVPDLPGHGRSAHRGEGAEYTIWGYCMEVMALANAMNLEQFVLLGHSMGGGIACLLAGLYPNRVTKLVLLDIIGTITTPAEKTLSQMHQALAQRVNKPLRKPGLYPSLEEAVTARAKVGVTRNAAALLAARGVAESAQGWYWCHDQRLTQRSLLSMSDAQVAPFLEAIACPVLLVTSREAVQQEDVIRQRTAQVRDVRLKKMGGGHHQHLDGDIESVSGQVKTFLAET